MHPSVSQGNFELHRKYGDSGTFCNLHSTLMIKLNF